MVRGVPPLDARRVDEDAHLMPVRKDLGCQGGDLLVYGEVGRVDGCLAPQLLYSFFGLRTRLVPLEPC